MLINKEAFEKIAEILRKYNIGIKEIAIEGILREQSIQDNIDKENIETLERVLEYALKKGDVNIPRELAKYGFRYMNKQDYELLVENNADIPFYPDYKDALGNLCKGWDWKDIKPNLISGSLCVWVKDGRYYYCTGYIDENTKDVGVICRRVL